MRAKSEQIAQRQRSKRRGRRCGLTPRVPSRNAGGFDTPRAVALARSPSVDIGDSAGRLRVPRHGAPRADDDRSLEEPTEGRVCATRRGATCPRERTRADLSLSRARRREKTAGSARSTRDESGARCGNWRESTRRARLKRRIGRARPTVSRRRWPRRASAMARGEREDKKRRARGVRQERRGVGWAAGSLVGRFYARASFDALPWLTPRPHPPTHRSARSRACPRNQNGSTASCPCRPRSRFRRRRRLSLPPPAPRAVFSPPHARWVRARFPLLAQLADRRAQASKTGQNRTSPSPRPLISRRPSAPS